MVENLIGLGHNIVETLPLVRVYTDKKGKSKTYSDEHTPLSNEHYLTISESQIRENVITLLAIQIIQIERIIFSAIFQDIFSYSQITNFSPS